MTDEKKAIQKKRKELIKAVLDGKLNQSDVARELGMSRQSVSNWVKRYKEDGVVIANKKGRVKAPPLTPSQYKKIHSIIMKKAPADYEIKNDSNKWDWRAVIKLLSKLYKITYPRNYCIGLLEDFGIQSYTPPENIYESNIPQKTPVSELDIDDEDNEPSDKSAYFRSKIAEAQKIMAENATPLAPPQKTSAGQRLGKHSKGKIQQKVKKQKEKRKKRK